jgi:4-hydroxy-tetrahydrodipicolinate reductase
LWLGAGGVLGWFWLALRSGCSAPLLLPAKLAALFDCFEAMTLNSLNPIAVAGASGRMGRMLIEAIVATDDCQLCGALDQASSPALGQPAAAFLGRAGGPLITADLRAGLKGAHFLIDFTRPEGTLAHLAVCRELGVKLVIGTTGFTDAQKAEIAAAAQDIAIVMAPNMSVGVNVTLKLLELAAKSLATGYDIEIIEAHHRHKVDAPSGTALKMGEVIADALGRDLKECAIYGREGVTGERDPSTIGFATVRGGDIVGDHTVLFAGIGERIEISHKSSSRVTYAQGSLRAVRFLADKATGLYDMADVLNLK